MCGIFGVVCEGRPDGLRRRLAPMRAALKHRGPDGEGEIVVEGGGRTAAIGHVRLAIIAPEDGAQPMADESGELHLTFNGAIYNFVELRDELRALGHAFRAGSDTEVLLRAYRQWGPDCLARLEGMYAFAVWDARDGSLFMARDRFGEKPLFYSEEGGELVFASEAGAVVAGMHRPAEIDARAVADYLVFKYVPGARTMFRGVAQLPAGSWGMFRDGRLTIGTAATPAGEAGDDLRQALGRSVRMRLRADVPIGLFLSGGIDSGAIAALAAGQANAPVHGFTADIVGADPVYSERAKAAEIAAALGMTHHVVTIEPGMFADTLEAASLRRGAPLSEFNDVAFLHLARAAREHVKVVLCGEGADELFAGYPRYWGEALVTRAQAVLPSRAVGLGTRLARRWMAHNPKAATLARAFGERRFAGRQAGWFGAMSIDEAQRLGPALFDAHDPLEAVEMRPCADPVQAAMAFDRRVWLPDNLLARGDRMTMAAPIEMRMPYLDSRVVRMAANLRTREVLKGRKGKLALRSAVGDLLPAPVKGRRKHGFRVPFGDWARGPMRRMIEDRLLDDRPAYADYLDSGAVRSLVAMHMSGRANLEKPLWSLLNLEIFLQQQAAA
jgi:asparagine synthase (glutamine-hydrolysing)